MTIPNQDNYFYLKVGGFDLCSVCWRGLAGDEVLLRGLIRFTIGTAGGDAPFRREDISMIRRRTMPGLSLLKKKLNYFENQFENPGSLIFPPKIIIGLGDNDEMKNALFQFLLHFMHFASKNFSFCIYQLFPIE